MPNPAITDKAAIDKLIGIFFGLFNNKNGSCPDLDILFSICIPEARILKKDGLGQLIYNLEDFLAPRKIILTDGTLTGFEEFEISEETFITGNIAQRQCRYRKSGYLKGAHFSALGTKLFQLVKTSAGWQIAFVSWEDDAA